MCPIRASSLLREGAGFRASGIAGMTQAAEDLAELCGAGGAACAVGVWIPWQIFGELLLGAAAEEGTLAPMLCHPCRWHVLRVA